MKIYVSGALTGTLNIEDLKKFYEDIGMLCVELGHEPYIPHLHSDPIKHTNLTPKEVYTLDYEQVKLSDLVIAYIGMPSLGVGQEIEIANYEGVPIIVIYEDNKRVSRMAKGNPAIVEELVFDNFDDALIKLRTFLLSYKKA